MAWGAAVEARHHDLVGNVRGIDGAKRGSRQLGNRSHWRPAWGLSGLAAAALLIVVLLPRLGEHTDFDPAADAVVQRLSELSHVGLVYPRVDRLGANSMVDYRTNRQNTVATDYSLWADRFTDHPTDTTAAFWLAASHLSAGRLDHADDVLRQALRLVPDARELRHLTAIVAYRRNDVASASRELETLLKTQPDDALATLNRAVLEVESGRGLAVCSVLELVSSSAENEALRHRAAQLLREAGCR